jgi:hypothetical protein
MTRSRTFTAISDDTPDEALEPIELGFDGKLLRPLEDGTDKWAESFVVLPMAPSGTLDDLMRSVGTDTKGRQVFNAVSLQRFMEGVLLDEDNVDRFVALMHDKNRLLPIDTLGDAVMWLAEEITDRPTKPPSR